jgi:hypothetical protein
MSMPPLAASVSQGAGDPQPIEQPVPTPAPAAETPAGETTEESESATPPQPGEPEARPKPRLVDELRAERAAKRQVEAELAQARVQQQQLQPLLEAVMTNPSVMTLLTQQQGGQQVDPELVDLAVVTSTHAGATGPAGRIARAGLWRAQAHAQQMIGPVQQQSIHQVAHCARTRCRPA